MMPPSSPAAAGPLASLWRMRLYARPYAGQMLVMLATALLAVAAAISIPLVIRRIVDGPVTHGDRSALLPLAALALVLGVVEASLNFTRRWIQGTSTLGMERDIRDVLYTHLQSLPPSFHDRWLSGQLLSRLTSDLSAVRRFFGFGLIFLVANVATFAAICTLLVRIDLFLGLVVTASLVPIGFLCARFHRQFSGVSRRVQDQTGDLASRVEEAAQGIRVVKAFGRRRHVVDQYTADSTEVRGTQLEKVRIRAGFASVLDVIPNATLGVVLVLGALAVGSGRITLGDLVAFITLALQLVWPVEALGFILASAQEAGTAAQRVFEVLDTEPEIASPAVPVPLTGPDGGPPVGRVRFEGVGYRFPGSDRDVLHDIDLDLEPGETLALVGTSGSGKTTLAMLLPRLADATRGRVTIDGHDVRDIALPDLRTVVATAFEEPILFSASVRENVTLGRPDATDADVEAALDLAQARFAHNLPWGLDTRVGEQGMSLSGGQRQRLALARAVLGRPRVLVLDDPLSALDVETEALVEEALRRVLAATTAVVVVHRPSTVALADRVAFLRDGTVEAVGTHADLMATNPAYAEVMGDPATVAVPGQSRREEVRR
ncbi:ABC transporter ATP-binding protein [Kineosporia sp. A_224]|uniref:ABC transporter ATP-binding protein n=1 Tax=Kineosporia sp. A_224 TaxID=1962180 RepID=UPI00350F3C63